MRRKLIIIVNHGTAKNYLPGVDEDFANYLALFQSNEGGAWDDCEISATSGWTIDKLKRAIDYELNNFVDYFLIVFIGHGYASESENAIFELSNDEDIEYSTIKRWIGNKKSLLIADSCRKLITIKDGIESRVMAFSRGGKVWERSNYREQYNSAIQKLEYCHHTFVASCDFDECANDTSMGGLYSYELLSQANALINNRVSGVHDILNVHEKALPKVLKASDFKQIPQIQSNSTRYFPPFVVVL